MSELSAKQRQILEYMKAEVREKGYPPSVREICDAVGLKSTSTVHGHLSRLEKKGLIRRDPTKPRIFGECVQAVVKAPYGAWPAQCYDYYDDDDAGLKEYDKASKYQDAEDAVKQLEKAAAKAAKALEKAPEDEKLKLAAENAQKAFELAKSGEKIPETFKDFLEKWVYSCEDQSALLDKLGGSRLMRLKNEPHLGYSTTH